MRRGVIAIALGALSFAAAGCGGSGGISLPCSPQPQGKLCIEVFRDGKKVTDAIGYLSASQSPLAGKTWRLVLTAGGHAYPGPTRHGNAPQATFCKDSFGKTVTTAPGCHDVLAAEYASLGDFTGFSPPKTFGSAVDLCVSEQIRTAGAWKTAAQPARACSTVS